MYKKAKESLRQANDLGKATVRRCTWMKKVLEQCKTNDARLAAKEELLHRLKRGATVSESNPK